MYSPEALPSYTAHAQPQTIRMSRPEGSPFGAQRGYVTCLRPLGKVATDLGLQLRASGPQAQVAQPHLDSCRGARERKAAGGCPRPGLISPKNQAEAGSLPLSSSLHQRFQVGDPGTLSFLKDGVQTSGLF